MQATLVAALERPPKTTTDFSIPLPRTDLGRVYLHRYLKQNPGFVWDLLWVYRTTGASHGAIRLSFRTGNVLRTISDRESPDSYLSPVTLTTHPHLSLPPHPHQRTPRCPPQSPTDL